MMSTDVPNSAASAATPASPATRPICWICLDEDPQPAPCKCPNYVHRSCLARWQLERLGKREERECRFCSTVLPPWQETLLPKRVKPAPEAIVNVHAPDGSLHRIPLRPGLAGRRRFLRSVRQALALPAHAQLEMSFEVAVPAVEGCTRPTLINTRDFSLASHIATVNAGVRRAKWEANGAGPEGVPDREGELDGAHAEQVAERGRPGQQPAATQTAPAPVVGRPGHAGQDEEGRDDREGGEEEEERDQERGQQKHRRRPAPREWGVSAGPSSRRGITKRTRR